MCGVATIPFVIWYSKQRWEWTRRSSSVCQFSSFNISVTLDTLDIGYIFALTMVDAPRVQFAYRYRRYSTLGFRPTLSRFRYWRLTRS